MYELRFFKEKEKAIFILGISLVFVIIGFELIEFENFQFNENYMPLICVAFFGLGIPIGFFKLLDKRPYIIIDENSIWERNLNQEIKWEQIKKFSILSINNQKILGVSTNESFKHIKKPSKVFSFLNDKLGFENINLNIGIIKVNEIHFLDLINDLKNSEKKERIQIIKNFKNLSIVCKDKNFYIKYLIYFLFILILVYLSLSSINLFIGIILTAGISTFYLKWAKSDFPKNKFYKICEVITYLGFINLFVSYSLIRMGDYFKVDIMNFIQNLNDKILQTN